MSAQRICDIPPYPKGDGRKTPVTRKRDVASIILTAAGLLLISLALTVAAYPFLSSRWGAYRAAQQLTEERDTASQYDAAEADKLIKAAEQFNALKSGAQVEDDIVAYEHQLAYEGSNILCWLEIPKLDVRLPVFRDDGTDDVPLEGAEHVRGTSLPVGGQSSNTVITAHSGSHQGTSMAFNKLEFLEPGDLIVLWTLGRPYAYKVTGYEIADPDNTARLGIEDGVDKLTLLTCRPIGTTAQRLFLCAERTGYADGNADSRVDLLADPDLPLFLGALGLGVAVLWLALLFCLRKRSIWYLNRTLGGIELSSDEVARMTDDETIPLMRLELKAFRRSKLFLFGGELAGRWHRVKGDDTCLQLEFDGDARGDAVIDCAVGFGRMRLPNGAFQVECLDEEISIPIGYPETTLVFSRTKPDKDDALLSDEGQHEQESAENNPC